MVALPVDHDTQLRLLVEADSAALIALIEANRPHLSIWLPWVQETHTLEDARRFIRFGQRQYTQHNGMQFGVRVHGQLAGSAGYNYIDHDQQQTEIGYWLGRTFQGKGIMTGVCRTLTTYAFDTLDVKVVKIRCSAENDRSRAIPERLGYTVERIVPQLDWVNDHYVDTVIYRMAKTDWSVASPQHETP